MTQEQVETRFLPRAPEAILYPQPEITREEIQGQVSQHFADFHRIDMSRNNQIQLIYAPTPKIDGKVDQLPIIIALPRPSAQQTDNLRVQITHYSSFGDYEISLSSDNLLLWSQMLGQTLEPKLTVKINTLGCVTPRPLGNIEGQSKQAVLAFAMDHTTGNFIPSVVTLPLGFEAAFGTPTTPEMPQRLEPTSVNPQPEQPVDETTQLLALAQEKPGAFIQTLLTKLKPFPESVLSEAGNRMVTANIGQQDLVIRIGGIYINSKNIVFQIGPLKELPTAALSNLIPTNRGYDHNILIEITVGRDHTGQIHLITQGLQYDPIFGYQPLDPSQVSNVDLGSFIPFFQSLQPGLPKLSPVRPEGPSQKPRRPSQEEIQRNQKAKRKKEQPGTESYSPGRNNGRRKARKFRR